MSENVTILGDWVDDYDALVAYDEQVLDEHVEGQGYSLSSMVIASGLSSLMKFSQSFVDVGRLGNGLFITGGWRGLLEDGLRALNLAPAAQGAVAKFPKMLRMPQFGNTCYPTALANSLRLTGQKWFITAKELAAKAGITGGGWLKVIESGSEAMEIKMLGEALRRMSIPHYRLRRYW